MSEEKLAPQETETVLDTVSGDTETTVTIEDLAADMNLDSEENAALIQQMQSELTTHKDDEIVDVIDEDELAAILSEGDDALLVEEAEEAEDDEEENIAEEEIEVTEDDEEARQGLKRERARSRAIAWAGKNNHTRSFITGWNALVAAKKVNQYVDVTINSVVVKSLRNTGAKINREVFVDGTTNNDMSILVPYSQLFTDDPIKEQTVNLSTDAGQTELVRRKKALCEKMYGMTIQVAITNMYQGSIDKEGRPHKFEIYGSRIQANKERQKTNFSKDENGNRRLDVGRFVDATILAVSKKSIRVTVGGADCTIPISELTFRYIDNPNVLNELYKVGDSIRCMISKIEDNPDGTFKVTLDASFIEMLNARPKQNVLLKRGARCLATITKTTPPREVGDSYTVRLIIEGLDMPAMATDVNINDFGAPLRPGDVMRCRVIKFSRNGMTYVRILNFHGPVPIR